MKGKVREGMNILSSVWLHPKKTVRHMIEHRLLRLAIGLILVAGFFATFMPVVDPATYGLEGDDALATEPLSFVGLLVSGLLSSVFALIMMFISVGFIFLFGKLFKGQGTYWDVFQATALATIPTIVMGIIGFVWAALSINTFNNGDALSPMMIAYSIVSLVLGVWSIVISIATLAEANRYSNWRAFFTLLMPTLIVILLLVVFLLAVFAMFV